MFPGRWKQKASDEAGRAKEDHWCGYAARRTVGEYGLEMSNLRPSYVSSRKAPNVAEVRASDIDQQ